MDVSTFNAAAQASRVSEAAARAAGVVVGEAGEMAEVREAAHLFGVVWGRNDDGLPFSTEVLRSMVHAGGAVTVARDDASGGLLGAAVLGISPGDETYSFVAAATPGSSDRGIGYAVKLRQRAWALERGLSVMRWTFDPLVTRNARLNLVKLGAHANEYLESFYGRMDDLLNLGDDSDRLVAVWPLNAPEVVAATEGTLGEPEHPPVDSEIVATGPDGEPAHRRVAGCHWIRAPRDIVNLRQTDGAAALAWRQTARAAFRSALADGLHADAITRDGWYRLTGKENR